MVFVCIFLPSSSNIKDCRFIVADAAGYAGYGKPFLAFFNETIPCEDFPSTMQKNTDVNSYVTNKETCDAYKNQKKIQMLKFKEIYANMTDAMAKIGPFKTWILTPASSVWIQFVSVTGMSLTGILLFLYVFNQQCPYFISL